MKKIPFYIKLALVCFLGFGVQSSAASYKVVRVYPQGGPNVGKTTLLQFQLFRGTDPTPLTAEDLQLSHTKLIHLMTIDSGFLEYHHEHPVESSKGVWQLPLDIKTAGDYRFFLQILPQDEILTKTVVFDDKYLENPEQIVPSTPVHPEQNLVFKDGEFKVTLNYLDGEPTLQQISQVYFQVEKNGVKIPIAELDDYLGAKMHIAAISADKKDFVHAHPGSEFVLDNDETPDPEEIAKLYFQQAGYYGLFMQYQYKGVLHTNQFSLQVKPASP